MSVKEAMDRGRFEGLVLQSLDDIKIAMSEMKGKHIRYDAELANKVEEKHLVENYVHKNEFKPVRLITYGMVSIVGTAIILAILGTILP